MQSGAFLQLILTLVALIARLDLVVAEIMSSLARCTALVRTINGLLYLRADDDSPKEQPLLEDLQDEAPIPESTDTLPKSQGVKDAPKSKKIKRDEIDSIFDAMNL